MSGFFRTAGAVVLAQSAVAVTHTGDTNETVLATISIPAGMMGANGQIEVIAQWSMNNNANTKTSRVKFGGTIFASQALTTPISLQTYTRISNSAVAAQVGMPSVVNAFASSSAAKTTAAINTANAVALELTGQLAVGTDTITLESYLVVLSPKP